MLVASSSKHPTGGKGDKGQRVKPDDNVVKDITCAMHDMSDTMRFTQMTHPNEALFKIVDDMEEYLIFVQLELQNFLATNEKIAAMLKGRPLEAVREFVVRWIAQNYPPSM